MEVSKTQAIANFLKHNTHPDLAELYNPGMEVQVNVAQDGGDPIEGEYEGRIWTGWTDHTTQWKSFRIPFKANSDPEYHDSRIKFDLAAHAEGIGMTGWDWKNRKSRWVAFDFDSIVGHSASHQKKLTEKQMAEVKKAACEIPWVTVRKSTGGAGLHLYVFLKDVETKTHTEHAALARAILSTMVALTGFDFQLKLDTCGGNFWVWRRQMNLKEGLVLIKKGEILEEIPKYWKDHIKVIKGQAKKTIPQDIQGHDREKFKELASQRSRVPLDDGHKAVINYLKENNYHWWWDADHNRLVTHTWSLKQAHEDLGLKGFYETAASGTARGSDHNCFAFPLRKSVWAIRRFSQGCSEHESWEQDQAGWTRCFYNRDADLKTAARAFGGLEDPAGGFVFREAELAIRAAHLLGVTLHIPPGLLRRKTILKQHKDGRLIVEMDHDQQDTNMEGWLIKKDKWTKLTTIRLQPHEEPDVIQNYDDLIRHLVTEAGQDYGWVIKSDGKWKTEPIGHVKDALSSLGIVARDLKQVIGSSVLRCWSLVNRPFQPEYPGNREWNRNSAQFRFEPTEGEDLKFDHWRKVIDHCGSGLDQAVKHNSWCKVNGIQSGGDYIKCWIASLFQKPEEPLPYLFLYGPQNSGKSILHEALHSLFTCGYVRADMALMNPSGFNGELETAILCVVEELDLKQNKVAYNRIKDWVTSLEIMIHIKGKTPYQIKNTTHFIQCANDHQACPVFSGDTRITMCYVEPLDPAELIPKKELLRRLESEASDFIASILRMSIPESNDRLNVPIIQTEDKTFIEQANATPLEAFIFENCEGANGKRIKFSDFCEKFLAQLDPEFHYSKIKISKEFPPQFPKGRDPQTSQHFVGNIRWKDDTEPGVGKFILQDGVLNHVTD